MISAWGLLNREATGRAAGIPHPGTFVIDPQGRVVSRAFEETYTERRSAASVLAALDTAGATMKGARVVDGERVRLRVGASDIVAAPGGRTTLMVDVDAGERMHVYAPGQTGYIPIGLTLAESPGYRVHSTVYPASKLYHFAPLNETVQVYEGGFRITQDVTIALTPELRRLAAAGDTLIIVGTLEYQACDDAVCYRPEQIPVSWTLTLAPIERPGGRGGR